MPSARGAPADQEIQTALAKWRRLALGVLALLVGIGLALAVGPTALAMARRDPVPWLQES